MKNDSLYAFQLLEIADGKYSAFYLIILWLDMFYLNTANANR